MNYEWIGKTLYKKIKKKTVNIRAKLPHVNKKPLARNKNLVQTKTRPRMNYEWIGKTLSKKIEKKNSKYQSEIAACVQKTTSEKANFSANTVFSLYFKFRARKFHAAKPLPLFRSTSSFGVTKIITPNLLQKS